MKVTYFNRYLSMEFSTMKRITRLIVNLTLLEDAPTHSIVNYLYGTFDGFDYSEFVKNDKIVEFLKGKNLRSLEREIFQVFKIINKYPRTENPNSQN